MNLIYSRSYGTARIFALQHEFMPGDWQWLQDADIIRKNPRADVYKAPHWYANPHRAQIDEALERALKDHRLGSVNDYGAGGTLGVSSW